MSERSVPLTETPYMPGYGVDADAERIEWSRAQTALQRARTYWLASLQPEGRPHVAAVWCVWMDSALFFGTAGDSRKARNLQATPACAVSLEFGNLHIVVEGEAVQVTQPETLRRMAATYQAKYDWPLHVVGQGVYDDEGNGGPVFSVAATKIIGIANEAMESATRWRFVR